MKTEIKINRSESSYSVEVGNHILEKNLRDYLAPQKPDKLFVIADENVARLHGEKLKSITEAFCDSVLFYRVPQGEESKSIASWAQIVNFLLENGVRRNTPVLVAGGGVTGDAGGFAAATALRGIPLVHIPTTLLAMVDSSIGGKTGINHDTGKNLIGSFYQPAMVIADLDFLKTLPPNEWVNGLSEILKCGAIHDTEIFNDSRMFLEQEMTRIDPEKLAPLIKKCIDVKAGIVEKDELESGARAYLNFGHTFAHALEKACNYSKISHGEAVFLGMLAAQKLSCLYGANLATDYLQEFRPLYQFRVSKEELSYAELMTFMESDKKKNNNYLRFVLLEKWQHPYLKTVEETEPVIKAWEAALNQL